MKKSCTVCHWNYCQTCLSSSDLLCVQCCEDPCKGCVPLSYPRFFGWSGICARCEPKSACGSHSTDEVCTSCKWNCCKACDKERPVAERVGGLDWYCSCSGGSAVVIEISDDEDDVVNPDVARLVEIRKEFPNFQAHWPLPGVDASDGYTVLLEHSSNAFKKIETLIHEATKKGLEPAIAALLKGYPASAVEPRSFKILDIRHIVDPLKYECYHACKRKMEKINSKRDPMYQFMTCEQIMFHGTRLYNERSITERGFLTAKGIGGIHGDGIYFSRYTLVPDRHTDRDEGLRLMFVCNVLEGRPDITDVCSRMPSESFDSGGDSFDGRGHKTVIFDNNHVYVEYAVYYVEEDDAMSPDAKRQRA